MRYLPLLFLVAACATQYKGPSPDFSLKGEAAEKEIENFSLSESYWGQAPGAVYMGPEKNFYYLNSVRPIINDVSPIANQKIKTAHKWAWAGNILMWGALAYLAAIIIDDGSEFGSDERTVYYSIIGASFATGFVSSGYMQSAVKQYNRDLRARFTPKLTYNWKF
ncbi:MAG: hypothetical protein HRT44_04665 [Bdellovibrionales bacterium]|nr:hypothetical protein [Bdellovibrionales bacterium]NQZ18535.1 hypothetical protein [Bdellovibrionales bacterium]